ncbi:MAG TPA: DUF6077 domain-containing protein, partial [Anaerolineales bacterium]|nr:DUF6077 domain-containing protein [Anaerolineales bacterium]
MGISLFLLDKRLSLLAHFTSGLTISVLLVGSLGLIGRLFNLPFSYIVPVFALTGLIVLAVLINRSRLASQLYKPKKFSLLTLALLLFMFAVGVIRNIHSPFAGDDFSYLAHLTNWQYAQPLSFQEVVFASGNLDPIRFWLAMFPMDLAFLAETSNLPGILLLGFYLEPYLIVIAILAIYNLYEDFLESEPLTIAALLLHFTFFVLLQAGRQPGSTFFVRISEDKVFAAFILAPAFFLALRHFLELFTIRSGMMVFLCGFSLALTHPIILAYSIFIAGVYTGIVAITERNYKKLGITMALLIIPIVPSIFLRFIDGPLTTRYVINLQSALDIYGQFTDTRLSYIEGTPFYGFDLERIRILDQTGTSNQQDPVQTFFSWSYLWLVILGFLWSLFNLKQKPIAPFIAATSLLLLLCGIPYTGWLVGYFVSSGMLWRSPWLVPIGLIGIVLLVELFKFVMQKRSFLVQLPKFSERVILIPALAICIFLTSYFFLQRYITGLPAIPDANIKKSRLENLASLGVYLEKNLEQPSIFVASTELMNNLPGLSSKSKVVYFRSEHFTPHDVDMQKIG